MGPAYVSPAPRNTAAILALYVKIGTCLLAIGAGVRRIIVAGRLGDGRTQIDALLGADQLVAVATLLELAALVVAAVLFLRWQVTAHRNLPALGQVHPAVGVRAGVAAWFVPGVNFVLPLRVVAGLWRAGEAGARLPVLLRLWWAAWVVALLGVVASRVLIGDAVDVGDSQRIDTLRAGATGLSAVAAAATIAVLATVTARQEARAVTAKAPRTTPSAGYGDTVTEGGLPVVSEEQARRGS